MAGSSLSRARRSGFCALQFRLCIKTSDMTPVVLDPELVADQFGNAGGSPEIVPVAVHHGPSQQQVDQAPSLLPIQL